MTKEVVHEKTVRAETKEIYMVLDINRVTSQTTTTSTSITNYQAIGKRKVLK